MPWEKAFEINPNSNSRMAIQAVSDLTQLLMFPDDTELLIVQMAGPAVTAETINVNEHFREFVRGLIADGTTAESIMFMIHLAPEDLVIPLLVPNPSENTPKGD